MDDSEIFIVGANGQLGTALKAKYPGAQSADIVSLVFRGSVGMAMVGIAIGVALSLAAGRYIEPLLFDASARDFGVLGGVSLLMLAIAALASVLPALRAKGTDPMEALRSE